MTTLTLSVAPRLSECFAFLTHELSSREDLSKEDQDVLRVLRGYIGAIIVLLHDVDTLYLSGPKLATSILKIVETIEMRKANGPISARMACVEISGHLRDIIALLSDRSIRDQDQRLAFSTMRFLREYASTKTRYPYEQPT